MKTQTILRTVLILSILALFLLNTQADVTFDDYMHFYSLPPEQGRALLKFKEKMLPYLQQDRMKKDVFLLRWLRARNFDVDKAIEMLKTHLQWRWKYNFDKVQEQNTSKYEKEYPIYFNVSDFGGRPTMLANCGGWNIEKYSSGYEFLALWLAKAWDKLERQVYDLQKNGNRVVTQWNMLFDNDKFTEKSVGCSGCVNFYYEAARMLEEDFPYGANKIWFLNSPPLFRMYVAPNPRQYITPETQRAFMVFANKSQWEPFVSGAFSKNQLPVRYGGNIANHPLN